MKEEVQGAVKGTPAHGKGVCRSGRLADIENKLDAFTK
jgi:hypothetical protein